ncbi:unnamed protein product [Urochloa humidicola]
MVGRYGAGGAAKGSRRARRRRPPEIRCRRSPSAYGPGVSGCFPSRWGQRWTRGDPRGGFTNNVEEVLLLYGPRYMGIFPILNSFLNRRWQGWSCQAEVLSNALRILAEKSSIGITLR